MATTSERNKQIYALKKKKKERFYSLKEGPCVDCGIAYPSYVMHWDHRDTRTKVACISDLLKQNKPTQIILDEIEKCDLVCANCHAERTHG